METGRTPSFSTRHELESAESACHRSGTSDVIISLRTLEEMRAFIGDEEVRRNKASELGEALANIKTYVEEGLQIVNSIAPGAITTDLKSKLELIAGAVEEVTSTPTS